MAGIKTFVAVGDSTNDVSNIGYSTNGGDTWQVADNTDGLFFGNEGYGIAYGLNQDGSGVFVAVGKSLDDASSIGYSLNGGQTWQIAANPNGLFSDYGGYAVTYGLNLNGSGVFVAVGQSLNDFSNIGYSSNGGLTWQVAAKPDGLFTGLYGNGIAYGLNQDGSGVFVAVGNSDNDLSNIGFSTNGGVSWQVTTATDGLFTGIGGNGAAVAYGYNLNGSGVFVAVGESSDDEKRIGYSSDGGLTWQAADNPNSLFFGGDGGRGVTYGLNQDGRGVFVAVGGEDNDSNTIGFSLNGGKSWQAASNTDGLFFGGKGRGVVFGYTSDNSGVFVAVGESFDDLSNIGYSFDGGQTWQVASATDGFIDDKGRAITFSRELPLSPPPPLPPLPPLSNVFVAVGRSTDDISNIGYSTDGGQNWIVANQNELLGLNFGGYGVAYGKNRDGSGVFVALFDGASDATNMGYSLDGGQTWLLASETNGLFGGGQYGYGVAYGLNQDGSGVFVAVGDSLNDFSNIGYSSNGGLTWQVAANPDGLFTGRYGNGIAYGLNQDGSGVFVAVGNSSDDLSNIGYSPDGGLTWQVATATDGLFTGIGGNGAAVAYGYNLNGSGVFVAVGESSDDEKRIGYSSDGGLTWQAADNPNSLFFGGDGGRGVTYGLNQDDRGVFVAVGGEDNDSNTIGFSLNGGKSWQAASNTDGLFFGGKGRGVTFGYTSDGSGVFVAVGESTDDLSNIGYSFDGGQTWQVASPGNLDSLFFGERGNAITFSLELPLSPPPPLPPLPPLTNVFVTLGRSTDDISNIGYSTDGGQNWIVANQNELLGLNFGGYGVAYGKNLDGSGVFVALVDGASDATNMGYSLDGGQTWLLASETNGLFGGGGGWYGYGVAYGLKQDGSGVFVAVGQSLNDLSNIGFSLDGGLTWQVASDTDGLFTGSGGYGIAYGYNLNGSGVFVAVGDSADLENDVSNIGYSLDGGETWAVAANPNGLFFGRGGYGIAYGYNLNGSGVFVAVGNSTGDLSNIGYSPDGGQTWQVVDNTDGLFFGGSGQAIAYGYNLNGSGVFVAVGSSTNDLSNIGYSSDGGQTWQVASETNGLFFAERGLGIAYGYTPDGSGVFVAVGNSSNDLSNIGYSFDGGQTWRVASPGNPDGLFFGAYGNAIAFSIELPLPPPTPPISNICFPAGTPIKTDQGIFPIEKLHSSKKTINKHSINKYTINKQVIQHITKTITQDPYLICFEKNAIGPNVPSARTVMTKDHKILFAGNYIPAAQFLKLSNKVKKVPYNGEILYNVLMKNYGTLQVNNLVCETLHPDNVIAKLYNNYTEAERPDLICQLNTSLLERDNVKYKAVERKISRK